MKSLQITMSHTNECLNHYRVEYKRSDEIEFNLLSPNPQNDVIVLPSLLPGNYDLRITGICCNGVESNTVELNTTI